MDPDRWRRIETLHEAALSLEPSQRVAYLERSCAGDESLRQEVESLLFHGENAGGFLEVPAPMKPLKAGQTISHYQILEKLGEGGMGVVYKARDSHLKRFVALKVPPPEMVADAERKQRFVQEARAASALNHPNIVTVHDIDQSDGVDFIAMEYVEGKTLNELIGRKGLKLKEALKYAVQIADALAKAHAAGIVHRDVKPGNVMVTAEGRVKVLDFGLAKLTEAASEIPEDSTLAEQPSTETGLIVGTVSYMSPEQAEGKKVDARSDIFSFGAVLYEMVTGRRAFHGDTNVSTLAAIIKEEPAPLGAGMPHDLETVIARCLRKDPARRFQHMDDVKIALEELKEDSDSGKLSGVPATERKRPWRWLWAAAAAAALLLAAVLVWRLREASPPSDLRPVALTSYSGTETQPSFSPDGNKVAFVWNGEKEGKLQIYVQQIGSAGPPRRLTTSEVAESDPAWSPDDRWIAFVRRQQDAAAVMLIPPLGGPERKLTEMIGAWDLSWTPDGKWLAVGAQDSLKEPRSIWAISVDTGERRRLTTFRTKFAYGTTNAALGDGSPSISPDRRTLAFARGVNSWVWELYVQRLTQDLRPDGEPRLVTNQRYGSVYGIAWTADGREIVYGAGGHATQSLWRIPVSGQQTPKRLPYAQPAAIYPAIARKPPRLVYTWSVPNRNLMRLDTRTKKSSLLIGSTYFAYLPDYSPDGRKIAFAGNRSGDPDIWTCDADGSNCLLITSFGGSQGGSPRWSPDGRWLAYDSREEGQPEIYRIASEGGTPRRVTNHPANDIMPRWSSNGLWIYFSSDRSGQFEVWKVPKDGGEARQVTRSGGIDPFESPDGKLIYYSKDPEGGLFRIPAQGGEETQILQNSVGLFAVTAKGVYFFAPGGKTVQLLDTATGKVGTLATLDKPGSQLTVSPDDVYVVYTQVGHDTQDLMLVENFR